MAVCLRNNKEMERWDSLAHGDMVQLGRIQNRFLSESYFFKCVVCSEQKEHLQWPQLLIEKGRVGEPFVPSCACGGFSSFEFPT